MALSRDLSPYEILEEEIIAEELDGRSGKGTN